MRIALCLGRFPRKYVGNNRIHGNLLVEIAAILLVDRFGETFVRSENGFAGIAGACRRNLRLPLPLRWRRSAGTSQPVNPGPLYFSIFK
jgi:hypothetical protein